MNKLNAYDAGLRDGLRLAAELIRKYIPRIDLVWYEEAGWIRHCALELDVKADDIDKRVDSPVTGSEKIANYIKKEQE